MSLVKRKGSRYWHYDFEIRGLRFQGSTRQETKRKAQQVEAKLRDEALTKLKGGTPDRDPITLNIAAGRYMVEKGNFLPSKRSIESELARLIETFGEDTFLHDISDEQIARAVSGWRSAEKAPQTINHYLACLMRLMQRAHELWHNEVGPPRKWKQHRMVKELPRERELTIAEQARLVAALEDSDPELLDFITFALMTGKRLSALRQLRWQDVDIDAGWMTFREKTRRKVERHRLPISAPLRQFLLVKQGEHPEYVLTYTAIRTNKRNGIVKGKRYPFTQDGWRKRWRAALDAAGIADFRFHDLRHTFGSRSTRNSGNLRLTQKLLNHKHITTTQRYAHVLDTDMAEALADPGLAPATTPGKKRPMPDHKSPAKSLHQEDKKRASS
tara:strand:+ start:82 stop:1239 length:1158 start_codon:yes stop_codon:yes gene_type:complete